MQRKTTFYVNKIRPIEYFDKIVWQLSLNGAFELPVEVNATKGVHDYKICDECQITLKQITKTLTDKFEGKGETAPFPFCCEAHSNLLKFEEFDRSLFINVPKMTATKIVYTNQHIANNHHNENWYKIITDYIDYIVESFGQMPKDCGEPLYLGHYFFYVVDLIKKRPELPTEKKSALLSFIEAYRNPKQADNTDLNILLKTYEKWFKEFPFEMNTYFGSLKQHYQNKFPIMATNPEVNIYSGKAKAPMHTKKSLIDLLVKLTNSLLTEINAATLYERGLITDVNRIKLDLIISSRKMKLKEGYTTNQKGDNNQYRRMLKEWFKDEKGFIDDLIPLLAISPIYKNESDDSKKFSMTPADQIGIKEILLLGLAEPDYSRVEFWQQYQKRSGYSEVVFWRKLTDSWKIYDNKIDVQNAWAQERGLHDVRLPLLPETSHKLTGHFGKYELNILHKSLMEYGEKLQQTDTAEKDVPIKDDNGKDYEQELSSIRQSKNEFWEWLPMETVIDHFEVMTKRKNKNNQVFLTRPQFVTFLKKGFLNDTTQPKQRINCSSGEKGFVIKRFYEFFDLAVSQYSIPSKKRKFIDLFVDCFDNWKVHTIEPFFKPNKTKERW